MGQQDDQSDAAAHDAQQDGPLSVPDEELPEDLQPGEDNPLAQPADDDVPDDVLVEDRQGLGEDSEDASVGGDAAPEASSTEASSESGGDDET
jgi:hypothetical protein